jgi:acyl-coenzyme A thioesterase PaaI-like protein
MVQKSESWKTRLTRWGFNLFPCYWSTGARITHIASDWREARVRVPLSWRTRNYVGTIFGGSMYGAVDPIYMMMLIKLLGPGYTVWDKISNIRFRRPGRSTLYAHFAIEPQVLEAIRQAVDREGKVNWIFQIELKSDDGTVHASVEKAIYIARDSIKAVNKSTELGGT